MVAQQAEKTRICGCGKEVPLLYNRCSCDCHMGLTSEALKPARTTKHTFSWGVVTVVRYDHLYNYVSNFRDEDNGISLSIDFSDGCCGGGPRLTVEQLPGYLDYLEQVSPKINRAIAARRALFARIAPLQARASSYADTIFRLVKL